MAFTKVGRLRKTVILRDLLQETIISPKDLVMPYFIMPGTNSKEPIISLPGISRLTIDNLIKDIHEIRELGIKAVLLFGLSPQKTKSGSEAYSSRGIVQEAAREIKRQIKDIVIITDVCLCGYTSHGHCGIIKKGTFIDNDETLKTLAKIACSQAQAGADLVAPSAMADGQVAAIRQALDKAGYNQTGILAYSAKFASNFYGPFREALNSAPQFGDRKSYQLDFASSGEALREIAADIKEGADMVMVKPALAYLDIIRRAKESFSVPIAAYNVSGEYAMIKAYAQTAEVEKGIVWETLTGIKRAGADLIITYWAKSVAQWLRD